MAKSTASSNGQGAQKTRKYLKRMLDDDKNKDYFDQIYYELAKLEFRFENESDGIFYMKKSAKNSSKNDRKLNGHVNGRSLIRSLKILNGVQFIRSNFLGPSFSSSFSKNERRS